MKHELGADFYDNAYMSEYKYLDSYKKSPYYKVWQGIIKQIDKVETIADFGCGSGQFLEMIQANRINIAYGVDFSSVGIDRCKKHVDSNFYVDSLYNDVYDLHDYDIAVFLEVLEHIKGDVDVVGKVPKGKSVILSVPNWDSASHVRHFESVKDVKERFETVLEVEFIETYEIGNQGKKIFVLYGLR